MKKTNKQQNHTKIGNDLKQIKNNNAVKQLAGVILWLSIATFVFAVLISGIGLAYIFDLPSINQVDAEICLIVFFILAFISTIALATLAIVMFLTLAKDKKLSGVSLWSIIIIFVFTAFTIVMRILNLLDNDGIINISDPGRIACYAGLLAAPIAFIIFGSLLFATVCKKYAINEQQGAK